MASRAILHVPLFSLALAAGAVFPAAAQVGPFAIGIKAGTLGIGGEASLHLAGPLVIRGNYTSYSLNKTHDESGITYAIAAKIAGGAVIADLHPTKGAFRISAGLFFKTPEATLVASNTGTLSIGSDNTKHDYSSSQVSKLTGGVSGKSTAPYLGLGFDKAVFTKGRVAFGLDLGLVMWGSPTPTLTATTTLTGSAKTQLDTDIAGEIAQLKSKIDSLPTGLKLYPVIAFSLKVRM